MQPIKNSIKYMLGLAIALFLRIIPHPPNVEPIMSTMMPFAKRWGWIASVTFTVVVMLLFDLLTGTLGVWSLVTIPTYALIAAVAGWYFKNRDSKIRHYVLFSIVGTIIYDAVTGIGTGMLFFGQSFMSTFLGQIPFTLYHLAGNVVLGAVVSPLLFRWIMDNPQLETQRVVQRVKEAILS